MTAFKWTLIKNATILSMDPMIGDFHNGDLLICDGVISAVERSIEPKPGRPVEVIDAKGMIMIPGFVDSHRHLWEGLLRNIAPNATLDDYFALVLGKYAPRMTAKDVYLANLVSALGAVNAGVTQILDWSHIQNSEDHTIAAVDALSASGLRSVFAYGTPMDGTVWWNKDSTRNHPRDVFERLAKGGMPSPNITLALAARGPDFASHETCLNDWAMAKEFGARVSVHVGCGNHGGFHPKIAELFRAGAIDQNTTFIHCTTLTMQEMDMIASSGAGVSLSVPVEMLMGHGDVPIQLCLDRGIKPSLSVDVETTVPGDMFTQMRFAMAEQRRGVNKADVANGRLGAHVIRVPERVTAKDVLGWATIEGARVNGLDRVSGSLTPGKFADLVLLNAQSINIAPVNDPYGAIVQGMDTSNVGWVMIGGKWVKQRHELVGVNASVLFDGVENARRELIRRSN